MNVAVRVVDAAACAPRPWANGGGATRELASGVAAGDAGPDDTGGRIAGLPAFDWRLSLADIDREGPFSALAGVDRLFAPIAGRVALAFGARDPVTLGTDDAPFAFDGALAPHARLDGGRPARALNLMCTRGCRAGAMRRVALADGGAPDRGWARAAVAGGAALRGWFVQAGRVGAGGVEHGAGTLLLWDGVADGDDGDRSGAPRALGPARVVEFAVSARFAPTDAGRPPAPRTSR